MEGEIGVNNSEVCTRVVWNTIDTHLVEGSDISRLEAARRGVDVVRIVMGWGERRGVNAACAKV